MGKIKSHIVISTDGYIAHKDDDLSWIPSELMQPIFKEYESADVLLAGFNTYNYYFEHYARWLFNNKTYIVSNFDKAITTNEQIHLLHESPIEEIEKLKADNDNILIVGGGKLITSLLNNKLIDEMDIYIVPVLLGKGIPLFGKTFDVKMNMVSCIKENCAANFSFKNENGIAHLSYRIS